MARKTKIIDKKLHRRCQQCGGELSIVNYVSEKKGYTYTEQFIECSDCGNLQSTGSKKKYKRTSMD